MYLNPSLRCSHSPTFPNVALFYSSANFFQTFYKNKHSWDCFLPKLFFIVKQVRFPLSKDSSTTTRTCQDTSLVTSTWPLLSRAHSGVICFRECLEQVWRHFLLILHSLSSRNIRLWLHRHWGKQNNPELQLVFLIFPC